MRCSSIFPQASKKQIVKSKHKKEAVANVLDEGLKLANIALPSSSIPAIESD